MCTSRLRTPSSLLLAGLALTASLQASPQTPLTTTLVAGGLDQPVFALAPVDDFTRLFIVEITGQVKIVESGALLPTPFIDLSSTVQQAPFQGLFGMAFHPDYWNNGYFYVFYAGLNQNAVVARYQVSGDANVADPASAAVLLDVPQPVDGHEGGTIQFGPDGYLYVLLGDGEPQNDPNCNGQNGQLFLSKMLRLDVDSAFPYAIPPDNPFVGNPNLPDEAWSTGHRHPWRFSFDRETGDMYMADNGQELMEELNFEPAGFIGGANYGWPIMEGTLCFGLNNCGPGAPPCNDPSLTLPLFEYVHTTGLCSIIGGYVYRGCEIPDLQGTYFFGDYCGGTSSNSIFSLRNVNGVITEFQDRTAELSPPGLSIRRVVGFGEDGFGELYICEQQDGEVFKIVPQVASPDCDGDGVSDRCAIAAGLEQDCDDNGVPDSCDIGGGAPDCNANGVLDECELAAISFCQCASGAPCGNNDPAAGCTNTSGTGASLTVCGTDSVSSDDLVITGSGLPANKAGLFFMGASAAPATAFGNGLRCATPGGVGLFRYAVDNTGPGGSATLGPGIAAESVLRFPPNGQIQPGQRWVFQFWFRDPMDPCGGEFNASDAVEVVFSP